MNSQEIRVVLYIKASAVEVWRALTDPDKTSLYWGGGTRIESDWTPGSKIQYRGNGEVTDEHTVIEASAPHRFSHTFEPKFGEFKNENPSKVSLEIKEFEGLVKLELIHNQFDENSSVFKQCRGAWPMILSSLKTLLETGKALPEPKQN